nr:hypothetical protein [Lachnospiraceae bacterium]
VLNKLKFQLPQGALDTEKLNQNKHKIRRIAGIHRMAFERYYRNKYGEEGLDPDANISAEQKQDLDYLHFLQTVEEYSLIRTSTVDMMLLRSKRDAIGNLVQKWQNTYEERKKALEKVREKEARNDDEEERLQRNVELSKIELNRVKKRYEDQHESYKQSLLDMKEEGTKAAEIRDFLAMHTSKTDKLSGLLTPFRELFSENFNGRLEITKAERSHIKDISDYQIVKTTLKQDAPKDSNDPDDYEDKLKEEDFTDVSDMPLFAHEPCSQDVAQGHTGNCYFLAAVAATINRQPHFIKDMMVEERTPLPKEAGQKQKYNSTVVVRFYRQVHGDPMPVYYRINKNRIPSQQGGEMSKSAVWVRILELAFAAFRQEYGKENAKAAGSYTNLDDKKIDITAIEGGKGNSATYAITGIGVSRLDFSDKKNLHYENVDGAFSLSVWGQKTKKASFKTGRFFNKKYSEAAKIIFSEVEKGVKNRDIMVAHASKDRNYQAINEPGLVESARDVTDGVVEKKDDSGILAMHAYSLIGAVTDKKTGLKYIAVRNPWGVYNSQYFVNTDDNGEQTAYAHYSDSENSQGVSFVELSHFVQKFDMISYV